MALAKLYIGDAADALHQMVQDKVRVRTVATSPPYWNLIDYEDALQLGQEPDPAMYIARLVRIFGGSVPIMGKDGQSRQRPAGVWDVLANDGTLFVNIGDTYARTNYPQHGIKKKDLCGIPEWFCLAMRKAGWHFRSKIIWEKPDANPETANDRPSRSHEDVFLFTKSPNYLYDAFAIREAGSPLSADGGANGRNARTVWRISKKSTKYPHFATFPPALPERIIRAGTSHRGQCEKCGKPWTRIVKKDRYPTRPGADTKTDGKPGGVTGNRDPQRHVTAYTTEGWKAGCGCGEQFVVPDAVLDPFAGTGTTLSVALGLGRMAYGIELVPEHAAEIVRRLEGGPNLFGAAVEQVIVKPRNKSPETKDEKGQDKDGRQSRARGRKRPPQDEHPAPEPDTAGLRAAAPDDAGDPVPVGGGEGTGAGAEGVADADPRPE